MAGSLCDFKYQDDRGKSWLIRIDRSNALATGTGFTPLTQEDLNLDYLPRNINPRYITAAHPTRPINRKIYCATTSAAAWTGEQKTIQLVDYQDRSIQSFNIKRRNREEEKYSVNVTDTYQTDNP